MFLCNGCLKPHNTAWRAVSLDMDQREERRLHLCYNCAEMWDRNPETLRSQLLRVEKEKERLADSERAQEERRGKGR